MAEKRTMTLNLTDEEMSALDSLSRRHEMTKTAIVRKALRVLQVIDDRTQRGERLIIEDEAENKKAEIVVI
jgi:hypothetical protein